MTANQQSDSRSESYGTPGPDPGIFERGVDLVAVIYSITNFFSNKIIEPRLLEKKGLQPPEPPSGSGPVLLLFLEPTRREHRTQRANSAHGRVC